MRHAFVDDGDEPTIWEVLPGQYSQPVQWPAASVVPQNTGMSPGTFFAGLATAGSLLVLFGKSSKVEKAVALQVFGIAAPVALGKLFQLQQPGPERFC